MEPISVLITSIGATGSQNVVKALRKQTQYKVNIIGTDASELNPGKHLVDKFYITPQGTDGGYAEALLNICKKENVRVLIPIMEAELEAVSSKAAAFSKHNPSVANFDAINTCNDKIKCQQFVANLGIKCPDIYRNIKEVKYPVILKQQKGTGSVGIRIFENEKDLANQKIEGGYILQQFVKGTEYTVDCFASKDLKFIECVPRIRLAVKGGLSTKTKTVRHKTLPELCKTIINALKLNGPSNIQFIETGKGDIYFIEVNPRFGGAYIASVEAGLNAPLFLLNEVMGDPIKYNGFKEITMLRYWQEVYE